ncbi:MAG: zinc-ribbon domain-containing protein [Pirellulales bacterium]|nr:zinc-ribbon domain-containing protein [Pirellulales bacterium]
MAAAVVAQPAATAPLAPLSAALIDDLSTAGRLCPDCGKSLSAKAVLCVNCGYNLKTGKKIACREVLPPDEEVEQEPRRPSPVVKFFSDRFYNPKVWGGLATMALSVIWFFGALFYLDVIFFYPPILFIFGAISFLAGLIDGADA